MPCDSKRGHMLDVRKLPVGLLLVIVVLCSQRAVAADTFFTSTWTSGVSGNWSDPANWTSVPGFPGFPQSGGTNHFTAVLTGDGLTHTMDVHGFVDALNLNGGI